MCGCFWVCFLFLSFFLGGVLTADRNRIDVLVNVAGVMDNFSSADAVTDEIWDRVLAVNLTVPVKMMRAVLPFMRAKKDGCVVNVASTAGTSGAVAGVAYTASKHGLVSSSLSLLVVRRGGGADGIW